MRHSFRPLLALGFGLGLAGLAEWRPELAQLRVFSRPEPLFAFLQKGETSRQTEGPDGAPIGEAEIAESTGSMVRPEDSVVRAPTVFPAPAELPRLPETEAPPVPIVDPEGAGLASFYDSLRRTSLGSAGAPHLTRVLHFGDSLIVSDYVSSSLRRLMQKEFGDAGHGYQLVANAWPSYFHGDVYRSSSGGFRASRISGPKSADRLYGLGGVTFRGGAGLRASFGTVDKGEFGRSVSNFVVTYLQSEHGGTVEVLLDGEPLGRIETSGPLDAKEQAFSVPDGAHRFELVLRGGESRLFGVIMERAVSGVTWSALGVQGARLSTLSENDDAHFGAQLKAREPALLVFQFGINESGDGYAIPMPELRRSMTLVLKGARNAVPSASCLVIGAMDRARLEDGQVVSMRVIPLILAEQRAAAAAAGCAFFDTYRAMGGRGSMPNWVKRGLGNPDMMHPSSVGADRIATWIFRALMEGYRQRVSGAPVETVP